MKQKKNEPKKKRKEAGDNKRKSRMIAEEGMNENTNVVLTEDDHEHAGDLDIPYPNDKTANNIPTENSKLNEDMNENTDSAAFGTISAADDRPDDERVTTAATTTTQDAAIENATSKQYTPIDNRRRQKLEPGDAGGDFRSMRTLWEIAAKERTPDGICPSAVSPSVRKNVRLHVEMSDASSLGMDTATTVDSSVVHELGSNLPFITDADRDDEQDDDDGPSDEGDATPGRQILANDNHETHLTDMEGDDKRLDASERIAPKLSVAAFCAPSTAEADNFVLMKNFWEEVARERTPDGVSPRDALHLIPYDPDIHPDAEKIILIEDTDLKPCMTEPELDGEPELETSLFFKNQNTTSMDNLNETNEGEETEEDDEEQHFIVQSERVPNGLDQTKVEARLHKQEQEEQEQEEEEEEQEEKEEDEPQVIVGLVNEDNLEHPQEDSNIEYPEDLDKTVPAEDAETDILTDVLNDENMAKRVAEIVEERVEEAVVETADIPDDDKNESIEMPQNTTTMTSISVSSRDSPTEDIPTDSSCDQSSLGSSTFSERTANASETSKPRSMQSSTSGMPSDSSAIPDSNGVLASGNIFLRSSLRTMVFKKWQPSFWVRYGLTSLYVFRSQANYEDWLHNPKYNQKQRDHLIKVKVDFHKEMTKRGLRGYKLTDIKLKTYDKKSLPMYHFKLEKWTDLGVNIAAAFAAPSIDDVHAVYDAIENCFKHCPYGGLRPIDDLLVRT